MVPFSDIGNSITASLSAGVLRAFYSTWLRRQNVQAGPTGWLCCFLISFAILIRCGFSIWTASKFYIMPNRQILGLLKDNLHRILLRHFFFRESQKYVSRRRKSRYVRSTFEAWKFGNKTSLNLANNNCHHQMQQYYHLHCPVPMRQYWDLASIGSIVQWSNHIITLLASYDASFFITFSELIFMEEDHVIIADLQLPSFVDSAKV